MLTILAIILLISCFVLWSYDPDIPSLFITMVGSIIGLAIYFKLGYKGRRLFFGILMYLYFLMTSLVIYLIIIEGLKFLPHFIIAVSGICILYVMLTRVYPEKEVKEDV